MNPCRECSTNRWTFKKEDGWITASCNNCKAEVRFQAKEGSGYARPIGAPPPQQSEAKVGDKCTKCLQGELKEGTHKPGWVPKEGQTYFFNRWLWCSSCKEGFFNDKDKVKVELWDKKQSEDFASEPKPPVEDDGLPF